MLVSQNFNPTNLTGDFYITRKLCARDVYLDYIAVMSSIDIIHQTRGGKWPTPDLTIENDLIDLAWHQREFEAKSSFAFTVMNKEETECMGCIYFYPPRAGMSDARSDESAEVSISWWLTQNTYDKGVYDKFCWDVKNWVEKDWPFRKVFWANKQLPEGF